MGSWGTGPFDGDSPSDLRDGYLPKYLEHWMKRVQDGDDLFPLLYIYIDYLSQYVKRPLKIQQFLKKLEQTDTSRWKRPKNRKAEFQKLRKWAESHFRFNEKVSYSNQDILVDIVGQSLYHLTQQRKILFIRKEGLKKLNPQCGFMKNREAVFASNSIIKCMRWRSYVGGSFDTHDLALVKFVVNISDKVYEDTRVAFRGDYAIANDIAFKRLMIID